MPKLVFLFNMFNVEFVISQIAMCNQENCNHLIVEIAIFGWYIKYSHKNCNIFNFSILGIAIPVVFELLKLHIFLAKCKFFSIILIKILKFVMIKMPKLHFPIVEIATSVDPNPRLYQAPRWIKCLEVQTSSQVSIDLIQTKRQIFLFKVHI